MSIHSVTDSLNTPLITRLANSCSSMSTLSDKVARFLVIARERTVTENRSLLSGLDSVRECVIEDFGAKEVTLETPDREFINGLHFEGSQKKALIYLHGNGCFYETSLSRPLTLRDSLKQPTDDGENGCPHLLVFNPRGTGKSEGITHPDKVAKDVLAAFKYLVNNCGIDPNDIVVIGHSMGAFFSVFGAALVQEQYPDSSINFISDRSFWNILSRVDTAISHADHTKAVEFLVSISMHRLIHWTKWNKDTFAALESLKGRVCIIYHEGDKVVPYDTSVHKGLIGATRSRNYLCLPLKDREDSDSNAHSREFTAEEHQRIIVEIKTMLRLPLSEEEKHLSLDVLEPTPMIDRFLDV